MSNVKNPALWEKCKKQVMKHHDRWNARAAQQAVKLYKQKGGKYHGKKKRSNSLAKWTREKWAYVNGDRDGRYLPQYIIDKLTAEQKRITNRNKKRGDAKGMKNVPWEDFVLKLWRKKN